LGFLVFLPHVGRLAPIFRNLSIEGTIMKTIVKKWPLFLVWWPVLDLTSPALAGFFGDVGCLEV